MKIYYNYRDETKTLEFRFVLEKTYADIDTYINHRQKEIRFVKHSCTFIFPHKFMRSHLHNDLIAFSALIMVYPFIGSRISFEFPISEHFNHCLKQTNKTIHSHKLENNENNFKRTTNLGSLSYSGGMDSTVASVLLPENTYLVFLAPPDQAFSLG